MDNFRYVNAGDSTLSAGIVAGDTQLSVANPGRFPAALEVGEKLVLTLHPSGLPSTQEIVICTAISGGVMTVTRGAQGTTAQGWPAGTVVGAYLTSEMLGQIRDKLMPISGTNTGDETAARIGMLTAGAVAKTTPANADLIGLADSAASNTLKKLTWSELKAALKTYFDTLYNKYVHPNHSGDVTSVADGAQTIAANAVTNMKLADMANATIKGRVTAGAGDPEDLTAAQARSILNVADGAQKNSDITKAEIEAKLTGTISTHTHQDGNADTVDGYHAQKTAAADKIPVAGTDGKLDAGWLPIQQAPAHGIQRITDVGTTNFVVPENVTEVIVMLQGGGGGGGYMTTNNVAQHGATGGTTSFGSYASAYGGGGGCSKKTTVELAAQLSYIGGCSISESLPVIPMESTRHLTTMPSVVRNGTTTPYPGNSYGWGGSTPVGGSEPGGPGGFISAIIRGLTPGESIPVTVGGGGAGAYNVSAPSSSGGNGTQGIAIIMW